MRKWIIVKLGGYPDLDSAILAIKRENDEARKNAILTEAVKRLFNVVGPDDIIRQEHDGTVRFGERTLTQGELSILKDETEMLTKSKLWRVLKQEIRCQLNRKMFEEANITTDMLWGKLIQFYDDVIRTCMQRIKRM